MKQTDRQRQKIQDSLTIVAKWIAEENNIKVKFNKSNRAYADLESKTIHIPALGSMSEQDLMLFRTFVYHEAGHIVGTQKLGRLTPKGSLFSIFNAVEDVRMEEVVYNKHKGCKDVFFWGTDFFNKENSKVYGNGDNDNFIHESLCALMFMYRGRQPLWNLSPLASKIVDECYDIFLQVAQAKNTKHCLVIAKEIHEKIKEIINEEQEENEEQESQSQNQESNEQEEQSQNGESQENDEQEQEQGDDSEESQESNSEESENSEQENSQGQGSSESDDQEAESEEENDSNGNENSESEQQDSEEHGDKEEMEGGSDSDDEGDSDSENGNNDTNSNNNGDSLHDMDNESESGDNDSENDNSKDSDESQDSNENEKSQEESQEGEEEQETESSESEQTNDNSQSEEEDVQSENEPSEQPSQNEVPKLTESQIEEFMDESCDGQELSDALQEAIKEIIDNSTYEDREYIANAGNDVHNYPKKNENDDERFHEVLSSVRGSVNGMSRTLDQALRAIQKTKKNPYMESGKIDKNKYVQIAKGLSKQVFYTTKKGQTLDVEVSIIVDESGSMYTFMIEEIKKLIAVVGETLSKINIKFEVIGATTKYFGSQEGRRRDFPTVYETGCTRTNPIVYNHYKSFDENWRKVRSKINQLADRKHHVDGEVVEYASRGLIQRGAKRKIVFSLSDGFPDSGQDRTLSARHLTRTCRKMREKGVEVYGFGIGTEDPKPFYGEENFVYLEDANSLNTKFFKEFSKILLEGRI